jgi:hypothetical protein
LYRLSIIEYGPIHFGSNFFFFPISTFSILKDSDNDDTNENTIKSQVDQAKQTKTPIQRNINKDKTNAQWYEATKLLKTRCESNGNYNNFHYS